MDNLYVMTVLPGRKARIGREEITFDNLGSRMEELFRTRSERLLLVRVEGAIDYPQLIETLDCASSRTQLEYGLMTKSSEPTGSEPSLFLRGRWIFTQYRPATLVPLHVPKRPPEVK